jgi:hypothetical protein
MKEPNDPARDGFLRVEDIIPLLAGNYRLRDDGDYLWLTQTAGKVRDDTLHRLIEEGWVQRFPNGSGFELTDEGRKAYMRSTDEMGDGILHPPSGGDQHG